MAAKRIAKFWDFVIDLLGAEKAFLPFTQDGAFRDDVASFIPTMMATTVEDKEGNQIFIADYMSINSSVDPKPILKSSLYTLLKQTEKEASPKTKGIVILVICNTRMIDAPLSVIKMEGELLACRPVLSPMTALHFCNIPGSMRLFLNIARYFHKSSKQFFTIHTEPKGEELLKALEEHGIDRSVVPQSIGGDLVLDHAKWLEEKRLAGL